MGSPRSSEQFVHAVVDYRVGRIFVSSGIETAVHQCVSFKGQQGNVGKGEGGK